MRFFLVILLAVFMASANAGTGLPAPCHSDFNVHASVDGQVHDEPLAGTGDIRAVSRRAEDDTRLMIAMKEPASGRLEAFTSQHVGDELVVVCGGETVWRARITAPFGDRFEIRLGD